jgi:hypothetical protein
MLRIAVLTLYKEPSTDCSLPNSRPDWMGFGVLPQSWSGSYTRNLGTCPCWREKPIFPTKGGRWCIILWRKCGRKYTKGRLTCAKCFECKLVYGSASLEKRGISQHQNVILKKVFSFELPAFKETPLSHPKIPRYPFTEVCGVETFSFQRVTVNLPSLRGYKH